MVLAGGVKFVSISLVGSTKFQSFVHQIKSVSLGSVSRFVYMYVMNKTFVRSRTGKLGTLSNDDGDAKDDA